MDLETFNHKIIPMRQMLLTRARQLLGNDGDAEDLVQETMLKLWYIRDQLDSHSCPEALARTILRNKAHDLWRRRREQTGLTRDAGAESGSIEARSDMELIEEIIAITGCSPTALRQNLSRARRKIREEFIRLSKQ